MNGLKKEIKIALLLQACFLLLNKFGCTADMLSGLIFGASSVFFLIGFIPEKSRVKVKKFKTGLFSR